MTNYMYYDYANSKVAKIKEDKIEYENARSMKSYFDKQCLENGSTLEGRKRSFIYLVHKKKYIPITISLSPLRIYFPIAPIKDPSCTRSSHHSLSSHENNLSFYVPVRALMC